MRHRAPLKIMKRTVPLIWRAVKSSRYWRLTPWTLAPHSALSRGSRSTWGPNLPTSWTVAPLRDQGLSLWSGSTDSKTLDYQRINPAAAAAAAKSLQSCPTLCDPIDGSPPGSPVPGILQARTLEWGAISFSNAWKWKVKVKSLSRVWLFAIPRTATYQGSSVHGSFQATVLEWVAIAFSKLTLVSIK